MSYIEIDVHGRVPIYRQIIDQIHSLVREGRLTAGSPLPSVRQLAADLEVNPNTVARSYGLLERDGVLETAGRRGSRVARGAPEIVRESVHSRLEETVDRMVEEAASLGIGIPEVVEALRRRQREEAAHRPEGGSS